MTPAIAKSRAEASEVMSVIKAIERGDVTVKADRDPQKVYAGDVEYVTSNGWTLVVFNDCDSWDYLDSAIDPSGTRFDTFGELEAAERISEPDCEYQDLPWNDVASYRPSRDVSYRVYGIGKS